MEADDYLEKNRRFVLSPPQFAESKMRVMRIRKMITLYISSIIAGNTERRFDSNLYDRVVGIRSSPLCVKRTKRRRRWRTGLFRKHATRKRRGGTWEEREHRGRERESNRPFWNLQLLFNYISRSEPWRGRRYVFENLGLRLRRESMAGRLPVAVGEKCFLNMGLVASVICLNIWALSSLFIWFGPLGLILYLILIDIRFAYIQEY